MAKQGELESAKPTLDLTIVSDEAPSGDEPDSITKKEIEALTLAEKRVRIRGVVQDISERKIYAKRVFVLVAVWLAGISIILLAQGFLSPWGLFNLSENVLLAVIGGTTVNVVGIFLIVARYLFPKS